MSWFAHAHGTPATVRAELERRFVAPLEVITDPDERATVRLVQALLDQCVSTCDPEQPLMVSASGYMGCNIGKFPKVRISIGPLEPATEP